ncbi:N-acetyltransferase-like protein [Diaporthe sp. PMI_573]|nr:N-acetyltransferase-like protein [Diaporthaceae sp. PMI_573]
MSSTVAAPAPRLRIRRATPDDAVAIAKVHFEAFLPGVMGRLLNPTGVSDDTRAKFAGSIFPPADKAAEEQSAEVIVMVAELEEDGGGDPVIVAFAKWKLVRKQQPREEWEKEGEEPMTEEQLGQGANAAVYNEFIGGLHRMKKRWMKGEPSLHLGILAATPTRHRLGAGSALLKWGCELADRENKTAWLEASPAGYSLYRKFGFEPVEVADLKLTELWGAVKSAEDENWGAASAVELGALPEGSFRSVMMRRLPKTS